MPNNVVREQQLQSVASAAQSFSLNTQDNTLSIVIEALSTAASLPSSVVASKTTPNLSIGSWIKSNTTYSTTITYDGDGSLHCVYNNGGSDGFQRIDDITVTDGEFTFELESLEGAALLYATETENFAAVVLNVEEV